jgi:hypothetical protein
LKRAKMDCTMAPNGRCLGDVVRRVGDEDDRRDAA